METHEFCGVIEEQEWEKEKGREWGMGKVEDERGMKKKREERKKEEEEKEKNKKKKEE